MRLVWLFTSFLLLTLFAFGCQPAPPPGNIVDDLGRSVRIEDVPRRIVSLVPGNTEILFALGLDDRVVGVTTYCNYPEAAKAKPKVGGFSDVDIEKVIATGADLVLATRIHKATVIPALEKAGITVIGIFPDTLEKLLADISLIGEITGKKKEATTLVANLERRIKAITDKTEKLSQVERPRVLHLTWHEPLWTAGSGTMINDLITKAGGENIARALKGHITIDLETVIQRNPEIILVMSGHGEGKDLPYNYVKNEPRFKVTEAVVTGRVYRIDADIFARTTPRTIDGLEQLARLFHPGLFK